jgi:hypothetical protein
MLLLVSSSSFLIDSSKFACVEFVSDKGMCWSVGIPADVDGLCTFTDNFIIFFKFRLYI